ncbi:DUF4189 domain-containing protein [Mycobacterium avium]|jgi:hypothetical protein|uniref:DUF4189 domain-containing protein n=1 Tax=Mycobacterium avium TaxID=1764 RepID=UPI0007A06D4C|nr:DUF4189 domain-containing protein [Mycobacterium avium]
MPTNDHQDDELPPTTAAAGSDETAIGPDGDETAVVPPATHAAPELAWSQGDEADEPVIPSTWGWVVGHAAVLVSLAFVVALVIGVAGWVVLVAMRPSDAPGTADFRPPARSAAAPARPSPTSTQAANTPVDDDEYVAMAISPRALTSAPDRIGGFGTAGSQDEANRIALSECRAVSGNDDCLLVNAGMYHGCVGFAADGPRWASGSGADPAAAEDDALRRIGAGGHIGWAQCSNPPGILKPSSASPATALPPVSPTTETVQAAPPPPPSEGTNIFTICPDGHEGVVGGHTTCAFAENVRQTFYNSGMSTTFTAYSPVTGDAYEMTCVGRYPAYFSDGTTKISTRCYGGDNAEVVIW